MASSPLFSPLLLGSLRLRNRVIRAGCFEGLYHHGDVTDEIIDYHVSLARGGVGMTTVAYAAVAANGRAFENELYIRPSVLPGLTRLVDAVHSEGAAASIQLSHCGFFSSPSVIGERPMGPSRKFNWFRMTYCREMNQNDLEMIRSSFREAALLCQEAGFDALEIHGGHGYLLSQFLSRWTNSRRDRLGGSLENRLRFPLSVLEVVREAVGPDFPILVKFNANDFVPGGVTIEESIKVAQAFEEVGVSALIPSCGFTSYKSALDMLRGGLPVEEMAINEQGFMKRIGLKFYGKYAVTPKKFDPLFMLEDARKIREAVSIPVIYVGGVGSVEQIEMLLDEGFAGVQIGRWLVRDPEMMNRIRRGEVVETDCNRCNQCIAAAEREHGLTCLCRWKSEHLDLASQRTRLSRREDRTVLIVCLCLVLSFLVFLLWLLSS